MGTRTGAAGFRAAIVALLATLATLVAVVPAGAHAELTSSDPQDGATLASAPADITFVFGEDVLEQGNAVTLTDVQTSTRLEVGPLTVDGNTVSVPWPAQTPAGDFRAAYRVVSADGHPIEGSITFTVEGPVGFDAASPMSVSASEATAVVASPQPSAQPAPADASGDGGGPLVWLIALGLAVLIGASAGLWAMRKTR